MGVTVLGVQHNFYPRSPCGERLADHYEMGIIRQISIHALLAESDLGNVVAGLHMLNFYPRSPCGERRSKLWSCPFRCHFYPRSPCGERPSHKIPAPQTR